MYPGLEFVHKWIPCTPVHMLQERPQNWLYACSHQCEKGDGKSEKVLSGYTVKANKAFRWSTIPDAESWAKPLLWVFIREPLRGASKKHRPQQHVQNKPRKASLGLWLDSRACSSPSSSLSSVRLRPSVMHRFQV